MNPSIFTRIINSEIPCHKIYEDEHTFAFLDIHPVVAGHTLVVHKQPAEFIWDLDDERYQQLMATVKLVAEHYRNVSGKRYVSIQVVGVDIPHNHVHVMPFDKAAELHAIPNTSDEADHTTLSNLANQLKL